MYSLTYVDSPRPCGASRHDGTPDAPHFRIERFATPGDALDRAREIIGASTVSALELYSMAGEVVFDAGELAVALGWPLPPSIHAS